MRLPRGRVRWIGATALVAAVASFAAVYLALSGGGDSPPANPEAAPSPTPAPAALTSIRLPGEGWIATEHELVALRDSTDPLYALTPALPACVPIQAFELALFANEPGFRSGTTLQFERPLAHGGLVRVTRLSATFSAPAHVAGILAAAKDALGGEALPGCVLAAAARDGIKAEVADGPPLAVPVAGVSRVLRYTASAASGGGTVTQALAWWGQGEQLVVLTISAAGDGPDDGELAAIARAAGGGDAQ